MNKAILTLPMMPVDGKNYGKFVTPIICETLSSIMNSNYYHCVNLLDSFNDRTPQINNYIDSLEFNGIKYSDLWFDKDNLEKLLDNVYTLINNGYITEIESVFYKCDCGVVEIEESKIPTCNPKNLKFRLVNNTVVCNNCNHICKKYKEKILIFVPNNVELNSIIASPFYLNKDLKTYNNIVLNSYVAISRKRNTGIKIKFNDNFYNIDIDFLWSTYLNTFFEKEKVVVSGNRMLYQLFLAAVVEKCLSPNNKTIILGTPYITNIKDIVKDLRFKDDVIFRKLFILFNMKWSKKEILYSEDILKYLNNISDEKRLQLYDIISRANNSDVETILKSQINMQECIKKLKLERR